LLVVLPLLWWWPLLAGYLPDFMDTVTEFHPMRMAAARQLWSGELPLWLPHIMGGVPLAANPQVAVWYPPTWLFFLMPGAVGNGLVVLLHYWLGGFGLRACLRRFGVGELAACFAGIGFQFGAFMVSRIALTPHLYSAIWIPWLLWAIEERDRRRGTGLVALFFALQLLAGAPQVSFYTAMLLPLYWLGHEALRRGGSVRTAMREVMPRGLVAASVAALLASVQLLPTVEFVSHSARHTIAPERLVQGALNGDMMGRALVGFTGNPIEDTDSINAIGLGLLALVPLAFVRRRRRGLSALLMLLSIFFWLLSWGRLVPLWSEVIPFLDRFHAPRRALIVWSLLGPVLAGLGAANLVVIMRARGFGRLAAGSLLVLLAGNLWMLPRLEREFVHPSRFDPHPSDPQVLGERRFLTVDPSFRYAHGSREDDYGLALLPDLAALHNLYDAQGYDPLILRRTAWLRDLANQRGGLFYPTHGVYFSDPASPALRLLAVQHLLGRWDLYEPGRLIPGASVDRAALGGMLELKRPHPRWPLWRFREERPLAWCVQTTAPAVDAREAMALALSTDVYRVAFVEEPVYLPMTLEPPAATARREGGRQVRIELQSPAEQEVFVVLAEAWMPGWRVLDGTERSPALAVNGVIMGGVLPPGRTELVFRYEPESFRAGLLLTVIGLLILGWLTGGRIRPARKG
jgi:hypothetical protein